MKTAIGTVTPNIGHADAGHSPDWPALFWRDDRLLDGAIDNKARFLEAAMHLFEKFVHLADASMKDDELEERKRQLKADLDRAIGGRDQSNEYSNERIERYRELARLAPYGDTEIPAYDEDDWFDEAVNEDVRGLRDRGDNMLLRFDPFTDQYTWKDRETYRETDWYLFQEAVRVHQGETWEVLANSNLRGLDLEAL